jgi:hypothetical protein
MAWGAPVNSPCTLEGLRQPSGRTSGGPPEVDHQRWCGFTGFPVLPVFQVFGFTGFPSFPGFRVFRYGLQYGVTLSLGLALASALLFSHYWVIDLNLSAPIGKSSAWGVGHGTWAIQCSFRAFSCSISPGVRSYRWLLHPAPCSAGLAALVDISVHLFSFLEFMHTLGSAPWSSGEAIGREVSDEACFRPEVGTPFDPSFSPLQGTLR